MRELTTPRVGYIGRALLHYNPWNSDAFQLQICAIIIGPTFICVSMYLTLKHVAIHLSPELSRIRPKWYPFIFLPADLTCLIVQAIGGGIAAAAGSSNLSLLEGGNNAIIAGIVLQVVVLFAFGVMAADYYFRVRKYFKTPEADPASLALWNDRKFRSFVYAVSGAYISILIRCIYRYVNKLILLNSLTCTHGIKLPPNTPKSPPFCSEPTRELTESVCRIIEMAGGWGNHIMQDEPSFLVLDSTLMLVATFLLTAFHPGIFFPQMSKANCAPAAEKNAAATPNETGESSNEGVKVEGA